MAELEVNVDRLNDFNWPSWKFRMELLLMKDNLWATVNDEKPKEVTSAWTRSDERARAVIGLALEDSQLSHIIGVSSAKEMWNRLKGYHERGSLSNKIHILRKICSMRLGEDGNMSMHLVQVSEMVHRLASMGEALKEQLVVAILLSSLPEAYNTLVTALEGRPEEELKLDYVKGKLLDEWRRKCESRLQVKSNEKTMKAAHRQEERRNTNRDCYYCKEEGHWIQNCPVLLARKQMRTYEQRNKPKMIVAVEPSSSGSGRSVCLTTTTRSAESANGRWILDTGCSKHMTGSTVSFGSMTFCEEKVILADGRTVTAKGRGQGRITGVGLEGEAVDMKLNGLLYVPGLSGNVLSVSQITGNGYDVLFGAKTCSVMKGSEVVVVGDLIDGLYYLRKPVVT